MNNDVYGKPMENLTMESLRNRTDVRLVSNKNDYSKWNSKQCYISQNILDLDLVAIRKSSVILNLNKLAHIGMCILDLSKVLMYELHYDYIKNKHSNITVLIVWWMKLKQKLFMKKCSKDKEMFYFSNYSVKSEYYDD